MLVNVKMTFKHYEHDKFHAPEVVLKKVKVYTKNTCSNQLRMKIFMLLNAKIPIIVGILKMYKHDNFPVCVCGGGGGGGYSHFFFIHRPGPSIYPSPKKISGISSAPENI